MWASRVIDIILGTGARVGEVLSATQDHIEFDHDRLVVVIHVDDPKEGDGKILCGVGQAYRAAKLLAFRSHGIWRCFGRPGKTAKQDYDNLRYHLRRVIERTGMQPFTLHDLRRTFASRALRNGASLEAIGQTLGHKSLRTTRRYARIDAATRQKVAEAAAL